MENKTFTFSEGSMWEGYPWTINLNCECSEYGGGKPCKHSKDIHIRRNAPRNINSNEKVWYGDIIVVYNEGEHNSTGLCLWCVLEAVDKIGLER